MGRRDRRARASGRFGVLLVDKPLGPTSHDLVGWARWALRERAIGHCGTLDPAASGMMVLCVGEATKLVEHLSAVDKRYRARFVLGASTTTADAAGEVLAEAEVGAEIEPQIGEALRGLIGSLELPPPAFSAIKVGGRRAHELARAGELTELPPRPMAVHELTILGQGREGTRLWVDVDLRVAKGTYVRSLAEAFGRALGLPAHMASLRRTACGAMSLDDPQLVAGLSARLLEPARDGRPPKWRVVPPSPSPELAESDAEHPRERSGTLLRACLRAPWTQLPYGVSLLASLEGAADDHRPAFTRLVQGQRLALDDPATGALALGEGAGLWALVDRAAGQMIIVEREPAVGRVAPRKLIRFPASTVTTH